MTNKTNNTLKVRDDILFALEGTDVFTMANDQPSNSKPSWLNKSDKITLSDLRGGIEPWLTSLFQSEHLSLLTGNGLSIAVEHLATKSSKSSKPCKPSKPCNNVMSKPKLDTKYSDRIEANAKSIAEKNGRGEANIEDYIRVINELLRGLEIIGYNSSDDTTKRIAYDHIQKR